LLWLPIAGLALLAKCSRSAKITEEQLVGTWTMTLNTTARAEGSKVETFGPGG